MIKGDGDDHITGSSASQAVIEAGDEVPILTLSVVQGLPLQPSPGDAEQIKIAQITEASQHLVPMLRKALDAIR